MPRYLVRLVRLGWIIKSKKVPLKTRSRKPFARKVEEGNCSLVKPLKNVDSCTSLSLFPSYSSISGRIEFSLSLNVWLIFPHPTATRQLRLLDVIRVWRVNTTTTHYLATMGGLKMERVLPVGEEIAIIIYRLQYSYSYRKREREGFSWICNEQTPIAS